MATGRAIVASRLAQLSSILTHAETALLVEPDDVSALAAALDRLFVDPELRARLGVAAQREARSRHSWDARLVELLKT